MIEKCGQTFGGLGFKAACSLGNQHHRCILQGTHRDECRCECGKKLGEPKMIESSENEIANEDSSQAEDGVGE